MRSPGEGASIMLVTRPLQAACLCGLPLLVASSLLAATGNLGGRAEIIDGHTIAIAGVDAPKGKQTCLDAAGGRYLCGSRAADALASIIGRSGRVNCKEQDRDRYG